MKRTLKLSYIFYLLLPLIVLPIIAGELNDPYILAGIAFYYFGVILGALRQTIFFPIPLIFSLWYWYTYGFKFDQYVTIFFICFASGLLLQKLLKQFDRFIHRSMPEQALMDDYDSKIAEMTHRLEQYKRDHPHEKLTQEVIEGIKKDVFFGKVVQH